MDKSGSAFPIVKDEDFLRGHGLTKREWFAGMALQGLLANQGGDMREYKDGINDQNYKAIMAYEYADSMLKAGEK